MKITHIEVLDSKGHSKIETGQCLKVFRETPAYYWVLAFNGDEYQVSKKTKKIMGPGFLSPKNQPIMNM